MGARRTFRGFAKQDQAPLLARARRRPVDSLLLWLIRFLDFLLRPAHWN